MIDTDIVKNNVFKININNLIRKLSTPYLLKYILNKLTEIKYGQNKFLILSNFK